MQALDRRPVKEVVGISLLSQSGAVFTTARAALDVPLTLTLDMPGLCAVSLKTTVQGARV